MVCQNCGHEKYGGEFTRNSIGITDYTTTSQLLAHPVSNRFLINSVLDGIQTDELGKKNSETLNILKFAKKFMFCKVDLINFQTFLILFRVNFHKFS